MFDATGSIPFGSQGDNDFFLDVASSNSDEDLVWQIARNIRTNEAKFRRRIGAEWTDWDKYVTNSDFEKNDIKFGSSYIQFGADHGRKCQINYMGQLAKNTVDGGELQPYSELVTRNDLQSQNIIDTPIEDDCLTANVCYRIKAGVCYVTVYWMDITSTSDEVLLNNNMPTSIIHCYAPIVDHNTGDNLGLIFIDAGHSDLRCRARKTGVGFSSFAYPIA